MASESNIRTRKSIVESVRKLKIPEISYKMPSKATFATPTIPRILTPLFCTSDNSITPSSKPSSIPAFSPVGRFSNSIFEKFKVRPFQHIKLSGEEKLALTKRIKNNQDMNKYSPKEKKQKFLKQHKTYEVKKMTNQSLKRKNIEEKTRYFKQLLETKFRRFEIRRYKSVNTTQESIKTKVAWAMLLLIGAISCRVFHLMKCKKALKMKNFLKLRRVRFLVFIISKFLGLFKRVKQSRALKFIKSCLPSKYFTWKSVNMRHKRQTLIQFCESAITKSMMFSLMANWNFKILFIQRTLRAALSARKDLYSKLIIIWDKYEDEYKTTVKKIHTISLRLKFTAIREYFMKALKEYAAKTLEFQKRLENFRKRDSFFWTQPAKILLLKRSKPVKPDFQSIFSKQVIFLLISNTQKEIRKLKKFTNQNSSKT